jgi:hypothetical protein
MPEHTPTLRCQIFSMLSNYRLCDVLQTIDDTLERMAPAHPEERKLLLQDVQHHLEKVILTTEKIEFFITE